MDTFTLTLERVDDKTVRATLTETENRGAFALGHTAADAISTLIQFSEFEVDQQELSKPETRTLGLARRVAVAAENIKALIEGAYRRGECVRIDYVDAINNRTTDRLIEPRNTFHTRGYSTAEYVNAYDFERGAMRSFRLDRIERAEAVE